MCRKRLSSPRSRSELIDSAWVVIVPGQKCIKKVMKDVPDYYHGKRIGPGELKYLTNLDKSDEYQKYSIEQKMNFLIWIALRCITTPPILLVPGWTGFNIVLRKNVVVLESKISYLDTLDSPATDIKTAYEILCRACVIKERLGLESVLCVLDQAFYAKAAEVIWKNKDIFGDIVIVLGGFHLLMMFLGVMGIRYGDAGLRDTAVQSDIIAEGSVKKVLQGKHYNRVVHTHKIVYEALSRLLSRRFMEWMSEEKPETVDQIHTTLGEVRCNMAERGFEDVSNTEFLKTLNIYYYKYRERIKKNGTNLQKFWFSYLQMCEPWRSG